METAQTPPPEQNSTSSVIEAAMVKTRDVEENKDLAVLSYAWILSVVLLLLRGRKSAFINHHAKQGTVLFILSIVLWIIPVIGRFLELFVLAGVIVGFVNASQGLWKDVPVIGSLTRGNIGGIRQDLTEVLQYLQKVIGMVKAHIPKKKDDPQSTSPQSQAPNTPST